MILYSKQQMDLIKQIQPISIYNRIKRVNGFLNKDYSKYIEAIDCVSDGVEKWDYSTSLEDLAFFAKSQEYILDSLEKLKSINV